MATGIVRECSRDVRARRFVSILLLGVSTSSLLACSGGSRAAPTSRTTAKPLNSAEIESATGTASPYLHRGGEEEAPAGIPLQPVRGEGEPAGISLEPAHGVEEPYEILDAGAAAVAVPDAPPRPARAAIAADAPPKPAKSATVVDAPPADRPDAPPPGTRRIP